MSPKPKAPDPRQQMIEVFRRSFELPLRDWLPADGAFTVDGRELLIHDADDPSGRLLELLRQSRREGAKASTLAVFVPETPDPMRMARLPKPLTGCYTLVGHAHGIMIFQMLAFDADRRGEYDQLLSLPTGNCFQVQRHALSAWNGKPLLSPYSRPAPGVTYADPLDVSADFSIFDMFRGD